MNRQRRSGAAGTPGARGRARAANAGPTLARWQVPTLPRSHAFTLIEVLVVIVVIGVLIAAISVVGVHALRAQKVKLTETTLRTVKVGIEQFANENPLAAYYDRKDARTFGAYPPYQLASSAPETVGGTVEPGGWTDLGARLTRDLSGQNPPPSDPNDYVDLEQGNDNDDIRALFAYLAVYVPDGLAQVPAAAKRALPDRAAGDRSEKVNPTGSGTNPPGAGAVDVLGIFDAWGVPLNYFLYVKLELALLPDGEPGWVVTDRIPVVMSHGHTLEEHEAEAAGQGHGLEKWIVSDPFPSPAAPVDNDTGALLSRRAGWARAKGALEEYTYVP